MKVVIAGCGWLGQQVAVSLFRQGVCVYGTARSAGRLQQLPAGIMPLQLDLASDIEFNDALRNIFKNAIVISAIPPGKSEDSTYLQSLSQLVQLMDQAGSLGCIHFSSTGVYQGLEGDTAEKALPDISQERVKLLVAGEQLLQQTKGCITLRLAGLMGPGRYPGRFIQGKTLPAPYQPVNMIHAADICRAVWQILQQPQLSGIYNLSCPEAVKRQVFYTEACRLRGLPAPVFAVDKDTGRRVMADKFCADYHFSYRYPSALAALADC